MKAQTIALQTDRQTYRHGKFEIICHKTIMVVYISGFMYMCSSNNNLIKAEMCTKLNVGLLLTRNKNPIFTFQDKLKKKNQKFTWPNLGRNV